LKVIISERKNDESFFFLFSSHAVRTRRALPPSL